MKRKIALLLVLALVMSSLLVLTSCTCKECVDANKDTICDVCEAEVAPQDLLPKEIMSYVPSKEYSDKEIYKAAANIAALNDFSVTSSTGYLVVFNNGNAAEGAVKTAILNLKTGSIVKSINKEASDAKVTSTLSLSNGFIVETKRDTTADITKYTTTLYTATGTKVADANSFSGGKTVTSAGIFYLFDNKYYEYKDDVATFVCDAGLVSVPSFDAKSDSYYYSFGDGTAFVYDKSFKLVYSYVAPSNAVEGEIFVLNDGNLLVQYFEALPDDAAEYELFMDGDKLNYSTLIISLAADEAGAITATETAIEFDYVVADIANKVVIGDDYDDYGIAEGIVNLVTIFEVENKTTAAFPETVNADNSLKILAYASNTIPGQYTPASPVAENRYVVRDLSGKMYLVDGDGKMIGEITGGEFDRGDNFILAESTGIYYDLDLKKIFDASSVTYSYVAGNQSSGYAIFKETIKGADEAPDTYKYYIFKDGKMTATSIKSDAYGFSANSNYFYYNINEEADGSVKYYRVYCNVDGSEILKVETSKYSVSVSGNSTYGIIFTCSYYDTELSKTVTTYKVATKK